jgi:hypothetical protein
MGCGLHHTVQLDDALVEIGNDIADSYRRGFLHHV